MTQVFFSDRQYNRFKVEAIDHADNPIVCSAISAMLFELAGMIRNADSVDEECIRLDSGNVLIDFKGDRTAKIIFDMTLIGFLNVQASNPNNLEVFLNGGKIGGEKENKIC